MSDLRNDANLVAYYRFESDGSDETANNNDLSASGTPGFTTGKFGNGVDFNGNSHYTITHDFGIVGGAYAISVWVKQDSAMSDYYGIVTINATTCNKDLYYTTDGVSPRGLFVRRNTSNGNSTSNEVVDLGTSDWHHIVVCYDGSELWHFLDGVESSHSAATQAPGTASWSEKSFIGDLSSENRAWNGIFDDLAIFSRALTDEEVAELWNDGDGAELESLTGGGTNYSMGDYVVLPTDAADLENIYTEQNITDVSLDDGDRVAQTAGSEYAIHQFKKDMTGRSSCNVYWNGQTDIDCSTSTTYLQVYNTDTSEWETLDSDSSTGANTDFDLSGNIADLTDYVDGSNIITCRVYQLAQ